MVIGAYPPSGKYNLCRGSKAEHAKALVSIPESAAAGHRSGVRTEGAADRAVAGMISDWLAFWDSPHSIYVNARHKDVHYRLIAKEIAALVPGRHARVLDYGSGEALHADLVAAAAGELLLCEAAPGVRDGIAARFAGQSENPRGRAARDRAVAGAFARSHRAAFGRAIPHRREAARCSCCFVGC